MSLASDSRESRSYRGFLGDFMVKNPPATAGDEGSISASGKDPLEKEMTTHSSILDQRIPRTGMPGGLSPWCHQEWDTTEHAHTHE